MQERLAEYRFSRRDGADAAVIARGVVERLAEVGFSGLVASDAGDVGTVEALAEQTRSHGLLLWVTVVASENGSPRLAADAQPRLDPWLIASDSALDPRRPPHAQRFGPVDDERELVDVWRTTLDGALAVGATGFLCRDVDRFTPEFWRELIASLRAERPDSRWVAWAPGSSPEAIDALVDAGFDTVASSLPWWDSQERWLADEAMRHRHARSIAAPCDPFVVDDRATTRPSDPSDGADAARLNAMLWSAALTADALLVPAHDLDDGAASIAVVREALHAIGGDADLPSRSVRMLSAPGASITMLARSDADDLRAATRVRVVLLNPSVNRPAHCAASLLTMPLGGFGDFRVVWNGGGETAALDASAFDPRATIRLDAGGSVVVEARRLEPITSAPSPDESAVAALTTPRIAIESVSPAVEHGRFPVKRTVGDSVLVEADIIIDGHEKLAAALLYRAQGDEAWSEVPMRLVENDRYAARFPLARIGRHQFTIEAWRDVFGNFRYELDKKFAAGLDVYLELMEGRSLVVEAIGHAREAQRSDAGERLVALAGAIGADGSSDATRTTRSATPVVRVDRDTMATQVAALLASQTLDDMLAVDPRSFATRPDATYTVDAERIEASFASWYELFPRSQGNAIGAPLHHGTFDDVIARLPAVRDMGFDVLYFPPIHPIGKRNRKGRNNSLTALEGDPGSPYAIGAPEGGHDALHPELGTFDDFRRLREAALAHGLELALDFAIQCSPDHPWLEQHPGWFAWRPDGSLRYAENPPKKYEDIVNVDFYGHANGGTTDEREAAALWTALRDVILLWVDAGVKIFRVDNPHTKSLPFWEWMIGEVRARHPDTMFLSEAFTRPKVMYRLAKVGFSQSYTYFTWRHTKQEFIDYLTELTAPAKDSAPRDFFRPNFFVNTPDINPVFLQRSGRPGHLVRAALAATLSGLWGVYSGFELCEATPVPGKEEYLDSEKYEVRAWDWQRPGHIIAEITQLNRIRRENPALQTHLGIRFEQAFDSSILYFSKSTEDGSNVVLVAINLDPFGVHEADFELPLWRWGRMDDATIEAVDLIADRRFAWRGKMQRMRLDPMVNPYAIWRVQT